MVLSVALKKENFAQLTGRVWPLFYQHILAQGLHRDVSDKDLNIEQTLPVSHLELASFFHIWSNVT